MQPLGLISRPLEGVRNPIRLFIPHAFVCEWCIKQLTLTLWHTKHYNLCKMCTFIRLKLKSLQTYWSLFRWYCVKYCSFKRCLATDDYKLYRLLLVTNSPSGNRWNKKTDQRLSKIGQKPLFYVTIHNCSHDIALQPQTKGIQRLFNRFLHCPLTLFYSWSSEDFFLFRTQPQNLHHL